MTISEINAEVVAEHGLSPDEYERVLHALGREPNLTELGIFSVMWSEHCSYKSSRIHQRQRRPHRHQRQVLPHLSRGDDRAKRPVRDSGPAFFMGCSRSNLNLDGLP